MNFYVDSKPVIVDTEIGCVVDFGIRKTFFSKSGLRLYNDILQTAEVKAFSCNVSGENVIFFKEGEYHEVVDGVKIADGFSISYSDSMRPSPKKQGIFFKVKFGALQFWSSEMFVPLAVNAATVTEEILQEIAKNVKTHIESMRQVALHKNKIDATIQSLISYEDLEIPQFAYWLAVAHLLLYRPQENLYKNFVNDLSKALVYEQTEREPTPADVIEEVELSTQQGVAYE